MLTIYVLRLTSNKYYVGKTHNFSRRIEDHINGSGSAWTKLHKPLKIIEIYENSDNYDENKYTMKTMSKYGIDNVRGGSFVTMYLSDEEKKFISRMICGAEDKCFSCGGDHFVANCLIREDEEKKEHANQREEKKQQIKDRPITLQELTKLEEQNEDLSPVFMYGKYKRKQEVYNLQIFNHSPMIKNLQKHEDFYFILFEEKQTLNEYVEILKNLLLDLNKNLIPNLNDIPKSSVCFGLIISNLHIKLTRFNIEIINKKLNSLDINYINCLIKIIENAIHMKDYWNYLLSKDDGNELTSWNYITTIEEIINLIIDWKFSFFTLFKKELKNLNQKYDIPDDKLFDLYLDLNNNLLNRGLWWNKLIVA
jgi:predicted GIY-YIG superfamily endonuclease